MDAELEDVVRFDNEFPRSVPLVHIIFTIILYYLE